MGLNLTQKILKAHLVEGNMVPGEEIGIRIDQTLTQDSQEPWLIFNFKLWVLTG